MCQMSELNPNVFWYNFLNLTTYDEQVKSMTNSGPVCQFKQKNTINPNIVAAIHGKKAKWGWKVLLQLFKSFNKAYTSSLFETFKEKLSNYKHSQHVLRALQVLVGITIIWRLHIMTFWLIICDHNWHKMRIQFTTEEVEFITQQICFIIM